MRIEELKKLPKLYRVITVDLDVLRNGIGGSGGVIFDIDTVIKRKVRRVLNERGGWRWVIAEERHEREWNYCLESDRECLQELNYQLGLVPW